MTRRRIVYILVPVVLATLVTLAYAVKSTPLIATFLPNLSTTGAGVSHDGNDTYIHNVDGVQCYFGVNGRNSELITYKTPRRLHSEFDPSSVAWQNSGLPQSFDAEVDMFGVNFFGPYRTMGVGTTAQVQSDLEFYVGNITYELDYQSLAAKRLSEDTWLITSNHAEDIFWNPGFRASDQAALNVIRRRSQTSFGAVNMPIRFEVKLK